MLTLARPPNKQEEMYYAKLVEMSKLHHKTKLEDGFGFRKAVFSQTRHPVVLRYNQMRNITTDFDRLDIEEDFDYDAYARCTPDIDELVLNQQDNVQEQVAKLLSEDFGEQDLQELQTERSLKKKKMRASTRPPKVGEERFDEKEKEGETSSDFKGKVVESGSKKRREEGNKSTFESTSTRNGKECEEKRPGFNSSKSKASAALKPRSVETKNKVLSDEKAAYSTHAMAGSTKEGISGKKKNREATTSGLDSKRTVQETNDNVRAATSTATELVPVSRLNKVRSKSREKKRRSSSVDGSGHSLNKMTVNGAKLAAKGITIVVTPTH